jgi:hypothetical protein
LGLFGLGLGLLPSDLTCRSTCVNTTSGCASQARASTRPSVATTTAAWSALTRLTKSSNMATRRLALVPRVTATCRTRLCDWLLLFVAECICIICPVCINKRVYDIASIVSFIQLLHCLLLPDLLAFNLYK